MDLGPQRRVRREPLDETIRERRVRRAKTAMLTLSTTVSGPLAGVTVLFMGSMAVLSKGSVDNQLGIALTCFAVALPFLLLTFLFARTNPDERSASLALWPGLLFELAGITVILIRLSTPAAVGFWLAVLLSVVWFLQVLFAVSGADRKALAAWQEAHKGIPKEEGKV